MSTNVHGWCNADIRCGISAMSNKRTCVLKSVGGIVAGGGSVRRVRYEFFISRCRPVWNLDAYSTFREPARDTFINCYSRVPCAIYKIPASLFNLLSHSIPLILCSKQKSILLQRRIPLMLDNLIFPTRKKEKKNIYIYIYTLQLYSITFLVSSRQSRNHCG